MPDPDVDVVPTISLDDVPGKRNQAFANLSDGPVPLPTKENYLRGLERSVTADEPVSFVVNMIVGHGGLADLPNVIDAVMRDAGDVDGKVVFVVGVNAKAGQESALEAALNEAETVIAGRSEPIALVSLPPFSGSFPYGKMRNDTMVSPASQFAVGALIKDGAHPYFAAQDFDAGSRTAASGKHVFAHVAESLSPGNVKPFRPLMVSGGYRVGDHGQLIRDTLARIDGGQAKIDSKLAANAAQLADLKLPARQRAALQKEQKELPKDRAALEKARTEVNKPGFAERFEQAIRDDMDARQRQAQTHPMLPYTPEPNLFVDAVPPLVDPQVRFGDAAAEFAGLGKALNKFFADEIVAIHTADPAADPDGVRSAIEVDAQNNRNPVRGPAFTVDFVDGAVETDLSRIALGLAATGKLPQSHIALPNVMDRLFGADNPKKAREAKGGVTFAGFRDDFANREHTSREPLRPGKWAPEDADSAMLGGKDHNTLNQAVSAPLSDDFADVTAGIAPEHKTIAGVNVAMSANDSAVKRTFAQLQDILLPTPPDPGQDVVPSPAPNPRPDGMFQAVHDALGRPVGSSAADLRANVAAAAVKASGPITTDIAKFQQQHPFTGGDLVNAFVEPVPMSVPDVDVEMEVDQAPEPDTGSDMDIDLSAEVDIEADLDMNAAARAERDARTAANAGDLAGRMIATHLTRPLIVHHPDGSTKTLEPFGKKRGRAKPVPVHLDAVVGPDGKTSFRAHNPASGAGPSRRAPVGVETSTAAAPPPAVPADALPGKKVVDDESWRHNPAVTAGWFAPKDPVSPEVWQGRRENAHVRTVDTVVADVTTDSTPSDVRSFQGLINFDVRRIEVRPNDFVREFTVKVHLRPGVDVDPAVLSQVRENAGNGVNSLLNQGFRLPSGDQFHVRLEFTDNPAEAHTTIEVGDTDTDQTHWNPNASPAVLAHETLHQLGVPDEYRDASRVFLERESRSGVHANDGGMMGKDVHRPDAGLRPRHLWLIERTVNSQVMVPDTRLDTSGPATMSAPSVSPAETDGRPAPHGDTEPPAKRPRLDDAPSPDVDMVADEAPTISLDDVPGKHNRAFAGLSDGPVPLPTKENYLRGLERSVVADEPVSFVVNMIVGHGGLADLPNVIDAVMRDAGDVDGKVVFVVGVNAKAGQESALEAALNEAETVIAGRSEPIALVPLPPFTGSFPYGKMRNDTMVSPASQFAVGALIKDGAHPYFAAQDFDAGSRTAASGKHVFAHVAESLSPGNVKPFRPLMVSGGYRVGDHTQLVNDTLERIVGGQEKIDRRLATIEARLAQLDLPAKERTALQKEETKLTKDRADLDKARTEVNKPGFAERFEQVIRDDMDARQRQAQTHPMLPYTPEPNLFVDAVPPLVDPQVRFGDAGAEFTGLGKALNKFFADEIVAIHTADPGVDPDGVRSAIEVDAQNNRNPVRGPAFTADFVDGAVETDLSRIALGLATNGKLPQSHIALTGVMDRFFGADDPKKARQAKEGTKFAAFRDGFAKREHTSREPLRQGAWDPEDADSAMLGGKDHNKLNPAVSASLPGGFADVTAGIAPEHKTIAAVNLAMSANDSAVKRTFAQLQDIVLPTAPDPRPGGMFEAVHAAVGRSAGNSAADLRAKVAAVAVQASGQITTDIANFQQQHPFTGGDLVNAFVEPGPVPPLPPMRGGDVDIDTDADADSAADTDTDTDTDTAARAEEDARRAANAVDLAGRMIATQLRTPLVIHHPDGSATTLDPFGKKPGRAKPVHLDAVIGPDGKTAYQPRATTSVPTRRAPVADIAGPSTEGIGGIGQRPEHSPRESAGVPPQPEPESRTRPDPRRPVLPSRDLPSFFQGGVALGTIIPANVDGGPEIEQAVAALLPQRQGVTPRGVDQIAPALTANFESFLGNGRNFQVKLGKDWFEANVKATLGTGTDAEVTPTTKVDFTAQSGSSTTQTGTIGTAGDVGGALTLGMLVGAQGTVTGKVALARPVTSTTTGTSTTDQRAINSGEGAFSANVPVAFQVTLTDARGNQVGAPVSVEQDVSLLIPGDSLTPADPGLGAVQPEPGWAATLEHPAPEAVTDIDVAKAFEDIARQLPPNVTKLGAPGRTVLQEFLSPTSIRDNLGAALNGWVVSPDLSSPHGERGGVVRMRAVPVSVELVGTTSSANVRVHESVATSTGMTAATKGGFDAGLTMGGGATVAGKVGGTASLTGGYTARTTESSSAGTSATTKTGIQVKGDLGLYRTKVRLEFETEHRTAIPVDATAFLRVGLPEAGAAGLPVPPDAPTSLASPTPEPKFPPPFLASAAAAGAVKVGAFAPAAEVQSQVENALRGIPGFEKFLPSFANPASDPRKAGKNMQDLADQLANQRKLATELSPTALKTQMDSLLGAGVQVQLKRQGLATNDFVNITVKAKVSNPVHLGQADARNVRGSAATGPKLDSSTATQKGWSVGVEAKVAVPRTSGKSTVTPTPSVGAKYSSTTTTKTTAGPTVGTTRATAGSPNAQLFQHDVTFEVEVTKFSRNRAWVKRVTPGSPWLRVPKPKTVAKTGTNLPEISGKVNLWVSDGSAMSADPAAFAPGAAAAPIVLANPPTIHSLLTAPKPPTWPFLHVEAVANTEAVRDAAIAALNASGDTALTVPGTESRNRIDKLFSPENLRANLPTLVGKGMTEGGMKFGRRVADRTGAVGMAVGLSNPKLVSISDDVGVQAAHAGGFKAGESRTVARSVDVTAGLNTPMKPTKGAIGSGAVGATAKWTPWSKTGTKGTEASGSVERNKAMPATGRTVLVQLDAQVTVVGESRASNTVHKGSPKVAGSVVTLPGGVFVRVSEDVARDMGVLPSVGAVTVPVEQGTMAPPSTLRDGEPGALGLGLVEQAPDLSSLVPQLRENLGKLGKNLLPKSVLNDSMNNLQRLTDLTSDASVRALVDSAMDGGVPLLVHDPGVFGKDTFQVTLKATPGTPVFDGAVNDGVDIEHSATGTQAVTRTTGGGTGWGLGIKVPGSALPKTGDPNVSATVGGAVAGNVGQAHSQSTTETTTNQLGHGRTGSGPAARFTVPVTFELVVEKGAKEIGRASSGQVEMAVRMLADNQKTTAPAPAPFTPRVTTRPSEDGTPASTGEWQRTSAQLPPLASVESLRGAQALQDAAIRALIGAGAGSGITGKGTGALNALRSGLALETLQPNLPGMLDGAFEVPGLHEAALTKGQHANVKVFAKLVNPRLEALSDGVAVSNPRSTVTSTSSEAKHSDTADVSLAAAPAGVTSKKPDIGASVAGVEVRHAFEDSAAVTGGATHNPATSVKTEGRTGLVGFDVEYRVVADLGRGRLGVTELHLPGAAQVRMPAADAEAALARPLPEDLGTAQTGVKEAADSWREAEVAADQARHTAQAIINDLAPQLVAASDDITTRAGELQTAEQALIDATTALDTAQRTRTEAAQAVERAGAAIEAAASTVHSNELTAALAEQAALVEQLDVDEATSREQAARAASEPNQQAVRDAAEARQQAVREHQEALAALARATELAAMARDLHAELVTNLGIAQANLTTAENAVLAAENDLPQARSNRDAALARRDEAAQAEQSLRAEVARAEAEVERTRAEASQAQQEWWQAKTAVDQEVDRFNAAPSVSAPGSPAASPAAPGSPAARSVSPTAPPATPAPEVSIELPPGSTSLTFQQMLELEALTERLMQLQATRAAEGSPSPIVEITGDHAAHVAELLSLEVPLEIRVAPGRPNAADVHVHLDPIPDTATTSEASVPAALDSRLSALTTTAMEGATPLMQSVASTLRSDPRKYVQSVAGIHLLQASVVLHTRTDEIAGLISEHGVDAVADAFIRQYERPIIETAQRESFIDLDTEVGRSAFESWAHQLWDTIENQPQFTENVDVLADSVFNHDKGYNRATNFAQTAALAGIMGPPPLVEAVSQRPVPGIDALSQATWVYQVFSDAGLIAADGTDTADRFTELVQSHRADLEPRLGALDDQRIVDLRQELVDMVMLDEDSDSGSDAGTEGAAEAPAAPAADALFEPRTSVENRLGSPGTGVPAPGLVVPDHVSDTQRQLRRLANDVLARPVPPPTRPDGLYAAVAHITNTNAMRLRQHVVNRAANDPGVTRAAADFAASRPMLPGHLDGVLVENVDWSMRPDPNENRSAGNARDLLGHLIATQLGANLVIHQGPGSQPVVLAPIGGQSHASVEVDVVVVNGHVTYRPHQRPAAR